MVKQTILEIHCLVANLFWHMGNVLCHRQLTCVLGVQPRPANTGPPSPRACGWVALGPVATLGLGQP